MRTVIVAAAVAPLVLAACQPCGLRLEGGGEATLTLSRIAPEGPDITVVVPGLSEAELVDYEAYGSSSPASLQGYLASEGLDGFVVAGPRGGDDWGPQLHLAASLDGVHLDCFSEPLSWLTVEIYGDAALAGEALVRFYTEPGDLQDWAVSGGDMPNDLTVDFDEGRFSAPGVHLDTDESELVDPREYCLTEADIEVVWETDRAERHDVPRTCGGWISMSG